MARSDDLTLFVREALAAGRTPDETAALLTAAGWTGAEAAEALDGWLPAGAGLPPVPRPRAYVSAREAVLYGLLFIALGMVCWHLTQLGFGLADRLLPDPDESWHASGSFRWNMASLMVAAPVFAVLNRRAGGAARGPGGRRRSLLRRWFAAVTLILSALAFLGDAVAVVHALLDGELAPRFLVKAAVVAVVAGLCVAYYRDELDER